MTRIILQGNLVQIHKERSDMLSNTTDWLTVAEFVAKFNGRVSRNFVYERIREGSIPSVRIGRKILIPSDALDRLMATQGTE
jgi:excisionase family DNA binding protein